MVFSRGSLGRRGRGTEDLHPRGSRVGSPAQGPGHARTPAWTSRSPLPARCRLAIQVEENQTLRAALGSALRGKEEDFRMYHETLAQVKSIFLQALRQQKADKH